MAASHRQIAADSNVIKCAPAGLGTTTRKRLPLVREKAGFTHDMTIFHHDVRRKRFIMHERVAQRFPDRNFRQNMQQEDEAV